MRVLITGGGCREYIDSVRVVTNSSSGKTSAELAGFFAQNGNKVTLITAENAIKPADSAVKCVFFTTGQELSQAIQSELCTRSYDAVIHAAAVSDYIPSEIITGGKTIKAGKQVSKLHSDEELTVVFRKAPKLADSLRYWAAEGGNPNAKIVCFKLTSGADQFEKNRAAAKLFAHSNADFIVANDLSEITGDLHPFNILTPDGKIRAAGNTNLQIAQELLALLKTADPEEVEK